MNETFIATLQDPGLSRAGIAQRRSYDPGAVVIREGEPGRALYLVLDGVLRVSSRVVLHDECGIQPGICDLKPGDVFGELTLFETAPRSATVTAVESCEVLEIDGESLTVYMDRHPEMGYLLLRGLYQILTDRLRKADERLESLFAWGLKAHGIAEHL